MLDQYKQYSDINNPYIAPFWKHFDKQLQNMYDPLTQKRYLPLIFNKQYWKFRDYNVMYEYYSLTMKFNLIKQIIESSNGLSLLPVINYNDIINPQNNLYKLDNTLKDKNDEKEGDWYISYDYDPNDIDMNGYFPVHYLG